MVPQIDNDNDISDSTIHTIAKSIPLQWQASDFNTAVATRTYTPLELQSNPKAARPHYEVELKG
jgi:hypothetical protein